MISTCEAALPDSCAVLTADMNTATHTKPHTERHTCRDTHANTVSFGTDPLLCFSHTSAPPRHAKTREDIHEDTREDASRLLIRANASRRYLREAHTCTRRGLIEKAVRYLLTACEHPPTNSTSMDFRMLPSVIWMAEHIKSQNC